MLLGTLMKRSLDRVRGKVMVAVVSLQSIRGWEVMVAEEARMSAMESATIGSQVLLNRVKVRHGPKSPRIWMVITTNQTDQIRRKPVAGAGLHGITVVLNVRRNSRRLPNAS
jgi:hypothetical protein